MSENIFEKIAELLQKCGIDPARVYVVGGAALHSCLGADGVEPAWQPSDFDLFVEHGTRSVTEDMDAVCKVFCHVVAARTASRVLVLHNSTDTFDILFPGDTRGSVSEFVRSFDMSVCKVYFRLDTWRSPGYMFEDTAAADIAERYVRVAPTLFDKYQASAWEGETRFTLKKLARINKYKSRGFEPIPDPAYESAVNAGTPSDWDSDMASAATA